MLMLIIYDLALVDIFNFSNLPNNRYAEHQMHISPLFQKRLCLVFSNLCNTLMSIAVQSSAPFFSERGVAPHILCADSALQVILADIKPATLRVEKEKYVP